MNETRTFTRASIGPEHRIQNGDAYRNCVFDVGKNGNINLVGISSVYMNDCTVRFADGKAAKFSFSLNPELLEILQAANVLHAYHFIDMGGCDKPEDAA